MFIYEHIKQVTWKNKVVVKFSFFLSTFILKQCSDCHQIIQVKNWVASVETAGLDNSTPKSFSQGIYSLGVFGLDSFLYI